MKIPWTLHRQVNIHNYYHVSCILLPQHGSYPGTCLQIFWSDADLNENTFLSSNSTSLINTDMECYHKWNRSSLTPSSERFHHRNGVNYGEADVNCNLALFISSLEITIHQQNTCQDYHFDQEVAENDDGWVSKICWFSTKYCCTCGRHQPASARLSVWTMDIFSKNSEFAGRMWLAMVTAC